MPEQPDKHIDDLYAGPPEEFVARRDELVRSLRKEGDRKAADKVKALRKPTVPAWAVNQLARRERMRLRSLLTAGERLRGAHEELLSGGSPEAVQRAREDERKAIAELARAAAGLLEQGGHPASEATLDRVRDTLHAAAIDEEVGRRVREGRLEKEAEATGFGFEGLASAPAGKQAGRKRPAKETQRERERKEAALEKQHSAEQRLRDARQALKEAERAVDTQARELRRAEDAVSSRRADVERAERELEQAGPPRRVR